MWGARLGRQMTTWMNKMRLIYDNIYPNAISSILPFCISDAGLFRGVLWLTML